MQDHDLLITTFLMGFTIGWAVYTALHSITERRMQKHIDYLVSIIKEREQQ